MELFSIRIQRTFQLVSTTLELETYLTDRIVLLANIRERALWGSSLDLFTTQFGLGIKFIIH